jgi:hypothetical protein
MASNNTQPESASDDAREAVALSEPDSGLERSTDDVQPATPHSGSHDELPQSSQILQHRPKESPGKEACAEPMHDAGEVTMDKVTIEVRVPLPERPWEYLRIPEEDIVEAVLEEVEHSSNELWYKIAFEDGREEEVSDITSKFENPAV